MRYPTLVLFIEVFFKSYETVKTWVKMHAMHYFHSLGLQKVKVIVLNEYEFPIYSNSGANSLSLLETQTCAVLRIN